MKTFHDVSHGVSFDFCKKFFSPLFIVLVLFYIHFHLALYFINRKSDITLAREGCTDKWS